MLFARVTSCVARRRQYQLHYGTIDFNHPPDQLGTWIPAFDGQEHHAATQSLIECVKGVTEDLARWKVGPALGGHDARAEVYWHACRLLLLRHVYRRFAEDTQCQQSAVAVLQLCEAMADGKIEYLNWVGRFVAAVMRISIYPPSCSPSSSQAAFSTHHRPTCAAGPRTCFKSFPINGVLTCSGAGPSSRKCGSASMRAETMMRAFGSR